MKKYLNKEIIFNVLAFIVLVATQFGYTGEVPDAWLPFLPVAVVIVNLAIALWKKYFEKPDA